MKDGKAQEKAQEKAQKRIRPPAGKSVGWALVQAARLHRARIGDRLADLGLFAGQEQVVQALAAAGSITMGDLAATLRVRPPTASPRRGQSVLVGAGGAAAHRPLGEGHGAGCCSGAGRPGPAGLPADGHL